jgi:hypothetical protein
MLDDEPPKANEQQKGDAANKLPAPIESPTGESQVSTDRFDYEDDDGDSGFGTIEKFVDGEWTTGGLPVDRTRRLIAIGTDVNIRRWKAKKIVKRFVEKPLPNIDLLNQSVPKDEWEVGRNGKKCAPYEHAYIVHLLDLNTAERTTFASATWGAKRGQCNLRDKVKWMRRLKNNNNIVPQVELTWAPFPTRYGMKKRPEFKVVGWYDLPANGGGGTLAPPEPSKQLPLTSGPNPAQPVAPKQVKEPTLAEEMNDEIGF